MTCYLCGSPNPTTKDHIPPKGFFPEPRPTNLITVPCCESCNNGFSIDDDAMRAWFCMGIGHSSAADWIIENKLFTSTFKRSMAFCHQIHDSMVDTLIHDENGQPMEAVQYAINRERTERFVIRIIKGLLRHYFPEHDVSRDKWLVHHLGLKIAELARFEILRDKLPWLDKRGEGVLTYRFGFTSDGKTGIWFLIFYDTAIFFVTHSSSETLLAGIEL